MSFGYWRTLCPGVSGDWPQCRSAQQSRWRFEWLTACNSAGNRLYYVHACKCACMQDQQLVSWGRPWFFIFQRPQYPRPKAFHIPWPWDPKASEIPIILKIRRPQNPKKLFSTSNKNDCLPNYYSDLISTKRLLELHWEEGDHGSSTWLPAVPFQLMPSP